MLSLTTRAADTVRALVTSLEIDAHTGGLRISHTATGPSLELALVNSPNERDASIEYAGVRVFLELRVTRALDDKLLDARVENGRVRFALLDRRDAPDPGWDGGRPPVPTSPIRPRS